MSEWVSDIRLYGAILIRRTGLEHHAYYLHDPHSATYRTLIGDINLNGDLAGPESSASLLPSWGQATVHFWPATSTVLDDNSLQCAHTAEVTTRRLSIFFFAARPSCRHGPPPTISTQPIQRSSMHVVISGVNWSRDARPTQLEMRDREEKEPCCK